MRAPDSAGDLPNRDLDSQLADGILDHLLPYVQARHVDESMLRTLDAALLLVGFPVLRQKLAARGMDAIVRVFEDWHGKRCSEVRPAHLPQTPKESMHPAGVRKIVGVREALIRGEGSASAVLEQPVAE